MNRALRSCLWPGLIACQLGVTACDPNVVIGARWGRADGGTGSTPAAGAASGATGGGGTDSAGTGGSTGGGASGGGSGGGGGEPVDPGGAAGVGGEPSSPVYFSADHEDGTGSLDLQWNAGPDDDAGGYYGDTESDLPTLSTDFAHSGVASAKATIDTSGGTDQISRLYRRVTSDEAYYSAWFYLPEDHGPTGWWSFFLFRAVQERSESIDLWSVNLVRNGTAQLTLTLFRHATNSNVEIPSRPTIPIASWFQLEAYVFAKQGQPSKLTLWLDGEQILALDSEVVPPADEPLYWVVGNGAAPLSPAVSSIYIDDAIVAASRTGP